MAHVTTEAERPHDLPCARKANGVTQLETEGLSPRGAKGVSPSPPTGRDPRDSSPVQQKKSQSSLCLLFCSGPQWTGGCPPTWGGAIRF